MRIFKTKYFTKWAKKEKLSDKQLCAAVDEISDGLIDAKLGDFIYKKRVASPGRGKRGGFRTILAFKEKEKVFFIYGFAKSEVENVSKQQLEQLKELGRMFIKYSQSELQKALDEKVIREVSHHG